MICPKCKTLSVSDAVYCYKCGKKLMNEKKSRAKSRGNGTGTAFKRGSTWTAQVVVGYEELPPFDPANPENALPRKRSSTAGPSRPREPQTARAAETSLMPIRASTAPAVTLPPPAATRLSSSPERRRATPGPGSTGTTTCPEPEPCPDPEPCPEPDPDPEPDP